MKIHIRREIEMKHHRELMAVHEGGRAVGNSAKHVHRKPLLLPISYGKVRDK